MAKNINCITIVITMEDIDNLKSDPHTVHANNTFFTSFTRK